MEFRERLYQLRKGRGISQEELANAVGVSRQAVQKWEAGASTPDLNNLSALADFFGVTLDYLVRGVEPEAPQAAPAERTVIHNYYTPYHYEYRSKCTLLGLPLVHIHLGYGLRRARGIIAIGNVATGLVAIGGFSAGLLSIGGLGIGAVCCILPYLLYTSGLKYVEAGRAAILASVEPVTATIASALIMHVVFAGMDVLGIVCILGAVLLLSVPGLKKA